MKYVNLPLVTGLMIIAGAVPVLGAGSSPEEPAILSQDLLQARAGSLVGAALWTRRVGSYTLQLVLPAVFTRLQSSLRKTSANAQQTDPDRDTEALAPVDIRGIQADPSPQVRVWMLRADGSQILPSMHKGPFPEVCGLRCNAREILYRFSIADGSQAVAAVISVGDEVYVEKLKSLEPVK